MFIFRYAINEHKLRAKLKANMLKPAKKSKFQSKMDDLLKQQQLQQNNKKK
jgi:YidC/Oxa1 family membrane protein insertase